MMVNIFIFHAVFVFDTVVCVFDAVVMCPCHGCPCCCCCCCCLHPVFAFAVVTFEVIVLSVLRCADGVKKCTHLHVRRARGARLEWFSIILGKDHCQSFKDGEDVENRENDIGFA